MAPWNREKLSSPAFSEQRSSTWFITIVVVMAIFTDILFYGLIIPFLPIILHERVGIADDHVQIWTSVLLGVFGGSSFIASPICGYLADRSKSRQIPLLLGLAAMACSTIILHLGSTIWILIIARVFQGVAAAILYSAGIALLYDSISKEKIGQAMGYITLAITAGTFLGPSLGGILYSVGREAAVFGLAYGVIALDMILRLLVIEKAPEKTSEQCENTSGYGTMNTASAKSVTPSESVINADTDTSQADEQSSTLRLMKAPRLRTALLGWLAVGTLLSAFEGIIPIFVQSTFGWSTTGAGLIFLPLFFPNLGGPLYGRIVDSSRQAGRLLTAAGFTLCLPFFVLLRLINNTSTSASIMLGAFLFIIGLGLAVCGPPLVAEVGRTVSDIEEKEPGVFGRNGATAQAYGLLNCAYAAGQLLGPLWAGGLKANLGWANMTWILGLTSGLIGVLMGLFLGGWVGDVAWRRNKLEDRMVQYE